MLILMFSALIVLEVTKFVIQTKGNDSKLKLNEISNKIMNFQYQKRSMNVDKMLRLNS